MNVKKKRIKDSSLKKRKKTGFDRTSLSRTEERMLFSFWKSKSKKEIHEVDKKAASFFFRVGVLFFLFLL